MINDISPGFVVLIYNSAFGVHRQTIPVASPTLVLGAWCVDEKGTPAVPIGTAIGNFLTAAAPVVGNDVSYSAYELYTKAVGVSPVLVDTGVLAVTGTAISAGIEAAEATLSFRGTLGGNGRLVFLDASYNPLQRELPPSYGGDALVAGLAAYLVGASDMVFLRDGTWPSIPGKFLTKTNDVLRRKYNLA